jgi:hypothetical protein
MWHDRDRDVVEVESFQPSWQLIGRAHVPAHLNSGPGSVGPGGAYPLPPSPFSSAIGNISLRLMTNHAPYPVSSMHLVPTLPLLPRSITSIVPTATEPTTAPRSCSTFCRDEAVNGAGCPHLDRRGCSSTFYPQLSTSKINKISRPVTCQ